MGSCRGTAWVFEGDNFTTSSKRPGRKLKLALRDGRGLALEHEATTMGDYKYAQVIGVISHELHHLVQDFDLVEYQT